MKVHLTRLGCHERHSGDHSAPVALPAAGLRGHACCLCGCAQGLLRHLRALAWAWRQPLREGACPCSHGGPCGAFGVEANTLFLVFLAAVCLQGACLHPSLLLLVLGRLQAALLVFALRLLPRMLPGCRLDGAALAAVNLQLISIFTLL